MRTLVKVTKALSDRNRLLVLLALSKGELCVCYVVQWLALSPSTVSRHLAILESADLVAVRREGRWAHYRLAAPVRGHPAHGLFDWLLPTLKEQVDRKDMERLANIRRESDRSERDKEVVIKSKRFIPKENAPR